MGKELANALKAVSVAESRASVAEVLFQVYFTFLNNLDHEYMNQFHTASRWCASPASFSVDIKFPFSGATFAKPKPISGKSLHRQSTRFFSCLPSIHILAYDHFCLLDFLIWRRRYDLQILSKVLDGICYCEFWWNCLSFG
ncbi:YUP8H12R.10 [Arabidopsis thaliana]|uniref:YUP8H12R.10 n=1 Tax=Arabidopsis thaliana TaxID=3702 RepID=O64523_ARATH|nr:YUP8H12R.10 [Arabidopsis thaliana]